MKSKFIKPISAFVKFTLILVFVCDKIFQISYLRAKLFGGDIMAFSYNKLWKILIDKNMKRKDLQEVAGISSASVAKLGKGDNITTDVLLRICEALDCTIDDILDTIKNE